jgi:hypothetical protein
MAARRYHFDRFGTYLGYVDEHGRYFDRCEQLQGTVTNAGIVCDTNGAPRGHIDVQGQYWDQEDIFLGYFRRPVPMPASAEPQASP